MEERQQELANSVNAMVLQMLQTQVRKTCFSKCFTENGNRFVDNLGKNEKICLAKCMDRMFEAYTIVTKASTEAAQNFQAALDQQSATEQPSSSF
jgi:import inner membrane translocase subunit TIM13